MGIVVSEDHFVMYIGKIQFKTRAKKNQSRVYIHWNCHNRTLWVNRCPGHLTIHLLILNRLKYWSNHLTIVMNAVTANIPFLYSGPLGNVKNARPGFTLIMHCSCHTYHSSICHSLGSRLCIWRLLKTILIRSMRSHHAMQTTTPWGKSFLLTWQEKNRKYYSLWRILVNLSNHNADGNRPSKKQ